MKCVTLLSIFVILQFCGSHAQKWDPFLKAEPEKVKATTEDKGAAPDSCSYTFHVSAPQLQRYCTGATGNDKEQLENMKNRIDAIVTENKKIKSILEEMKKKCYENDDSIKKIMKETAAWREIIHWPKTTDNINPGNLSQIIDKELEYEDCMAVYKSGNKKKGIYNLNPGVDDSFLAFCDEGWVVIQRRFNGKTSFHRDWDEYSEGFGDLSGEFWLGNERIHRLTEAGNTEFRFEGVTYKDKMFRVTYDDFQIGDDESEYELRVGNKTAGSYRDVLTRLDGLKFSTHDNDNDEWSRGNCGRHYRVGWWLRSCGWSPNHEYCRGSTCMKWGDRNLKKSQLKIRRKQE